ncbi:AMP-binding protein [Pseudorhodoferax sp. Leaf274]|uniref:AMP-binding protein n=1 Tax=Pseudorhodoferax sp. Leaf274 TaxID=1736318 RepID=UPI0007039DC2|nr:AMP-binding protein [Pseudorhodoferax sp. Leaf274]KQP44204.1 AMP-dependent synthetase [Pseudorhodoferax sp. Leaf274]
MNLAVLLDQAATRHAGLPAVCLGTETLWTFAQLHARVGAIAAALRADHAPGARIALCSENRPEYVELLFGIWAAGLVAVPVNYKLHAREVRQIVEDAGAALAFASPGLAPDLQQALPCPVIALDGAAYRALLAPAPLQIAPVAADALAWLFYTSGTTGRSKGAMLTHGNLLAMAVAHLADIEPELGPQCSQLHGAPMSHGSGLYLLPSLARGARQVVPASHGFEPDEFLALCDTHPGSGAFLAPTMVQRLREALAARGGRRPRQLRCIVYGGGPMYLQELRRAMDAFGPVFAQIYGQGETPMTITGLTRADHGSADAQQLASVGWPRSGTEVAILGAQGAPLPAGEPGEIAVRGATVMAGYWRNPEATAQALPQGAGGWLWTGDIGVLDHGGRLSLRDRSKDVVISGGSNIYPREVEEVLLTHPGVAEACVVGAPDAQWGEVVVAYVVVAPGLPQDAAALDAHCLAHIARFKRPKRYVFVDALPKNSYGKVLKRALRELDAQREAPQG